MWRNGLLFKILFWRYLIEEGKNNLGLFFKVKNGIYLN